MRSFVPLTRGDPEPTVSFALRNPPEEPLLGVGAHGGSAWVQGEPVQSDAAVNIITFRGVVRFERRIIIRLRCLLRAGPRSGPSGAQLCPFAVVTGLVP